MAAVGVGLDVARLHRRDRPDRDGLLALAEVRGALDEAAHEELLDLLLEEPDLHHLAVPAGERRRVGRRSRVGSCVLSLSAPERAGRSRLVRSGAWGWRVQPFPAAAGALCTSRPGTVKPAVGVGPAVGARSPLTGRRGRVGSTRLETTPGNAYRGTGRRRTRCCGSSGSRPFPSACRCRSPTRGSHYRMRNRCTIITRVHTAEGIVGEGYTADEDEPLQSRDPGDPARGARPARHRARRAADRARLGGDAPGDVRPAPAALVRDAGDRLHRHAVWDAVGKAYGQPLWRLWGGYRDRVPMIGIGGYYIPDSEAAKGQEIEREIDFFAGEHGMVGMKFKVGARPPAEDAARLAARPAARRATTSCSSWMPTRASPCPRRSRSWPPSGPRASSRAGSRSRPAGTPTSGACATSGCAETWTWRPARARSAAWACAR